MFELENEYIDLVDGRTLAARIFLPDDVYSNPAPAILEYLPYRKRDGTAPRDESYYPYFASHGYAGVRVDISGTGESEGDFDDEYSPRELADGVEVLNWIANQPWCDGNLGMMGISWGGFNSMQIAALRPKPLKAIISIGTTVDRYNDDIHYKQGCHLYSNFGWSSVLLCFASRPPDPMLVGERWQSIWQHRLETQPFPLTTWLAHQRRDEYWKHGSIAEDYNAIDVPSLIISGWSDGYINAPPAMAENSNAFSRAINGPWIHKYPHFAWPKPRMDFLAEATAWWDRWLKNRSNGVEQLPAYRAYISEQVRPGGYRYFEPGRWISEQNWPSGGIQNRPYFIGSDRSLRIDAGPEAILNICSPQDCGVACGEFFTLKPDSELPGDQRIDDAGSLVFETDVLDESVEILGRPMVNLQLSIDQPQGNIVVRLIDVHPDGIAYRVSWGVLNLSHRNDQEFPESMSPGVYECIEISLDHCGYQFVPGHRIRLSISTAYWPMIVPPPYSVTASIKTVTESRLWLPVRSGSDHIEVPEPADHNPLPEYRCIQQPNYKRWIEKDLQNQLTHYHVFDDTGEFESPGHKMCTRHTHEARWSIDPDEPLSYNVYSIYICYMRRDEWQIKTVSKSKLCCDKDNYYLDATVTAFCDDDIFNQRNWKETIVRDFT